MGLPNFDKVTDVEFERFCFDLLGDLGFVNIDWRKGTPRSSSPADSGRDIVAELTKVDIDDTRRFERWFIDCKHYKTAVPPAKLSNLLSWSAAERPDVALFVVSGYLSNPAKDFLVKYTENERPFFRVKYWERPMLEKLSRRERREIEATKVRLAADRLMQSFTASGGLNYKGMGAFSSEGRMDFRNLIGILSTVDDERLQQYGRELESEYSSAEDDATPQKDLSDSVKSVAVAMLRHFDSDAVPYKKAVKVLGLIIERARALERVELI